MSTERERYLSEPDPNELLTPAEVSALTRRPLSTLRSWRLRGTGPESFQLGRCTVYRRGDVEAWIAKRRQQTGRGAA